MIIKELNIIEFGGLTDKRIELSEGLNVIEGNNETGKSTLWLFIKFMLYGMPKKSNPERERSISRSSHRAAGTMTLSFGGEDYRIERSFSENARGRVVTYRLSNGERVFIGEEPGEAMLSVPRDVFENSVAIGQGACSGLGGEKGAAAIRNLLSSADESVDVDKIRRKLDSVRVTYRHVNGKGGRLYELSEKKSLLTDRLSRAVENQLKVKNIEESLKKSKENIDVAEKELETASKLADRLNKREILQRFDALAEDEKELLELREQRDKMLSEETREGYVPFAADGAALSMTADSLDHAQADLEDAEEELLRAEKNACSHNDNEYAELGGRIEAEGGVDAVLALIAKAENKKRIGIVTIIAGAVIAALTLWNVLAIVGIIACVAALIVGVALVAKGCEERKRGLLSDIRSGEEGRLYCEKCAEAYRNTELCKKELAEAEEKKRSAERLAEHLKNELVRAMDRVRSDAIPTAENARAEVRRIERFVREYGELGAKTENLRDRVQRDRALLSAYNETELRMSLGEHELPDMTVRTAEENQRFYSQKLAKLRERETVLRTELINLKAIGEDPDRLMDELEAIRGEYAEAERFYDALMTAIEGVDTAAAVLRGSVTPAIGRNAAELITGITNGKYADVNLGRDLDVTLIDERELSTTSTMMSGGMRDTAYLALRISLMRSIFCEELPPLMMDETLCQLDRERTERALRMLERLSADELQILLFTCHEREAEICNRLKIKANMVKMGV